MSSDIVPTLLDEIQKDFQKQFNSNSTISSIYGKLKSKNATYKEANEFAIQCGEMLAKSFSKYISADTLPEGRMWYNIATRILNPTLRNNYSLITDVTDQTQTILNEKAGIGLKPLTPAFNTDRVNGLINKVSNAEDYNDVSWLLQEPVVNYSQSVVDEAIKGNADYQYKSGLQPKIVRTLDSFEYKSIRVGNKKVSYQVPCKWCQGLAGTYDYPYVPSDVYRRHENCRCTVEYIGAGKKQNVWSKAYEQTDRESRQEWQQEALKKVENRKEAKEVLIKDVGFDIVEDSFNRINEDILKTNVEQLQKLEKRFKIIHQSKGSFGAENLKGASAYVSSRSSNPLFQNMSLCSSSYGNSFDWYIQNELKSHQSGEFMPCLLDEKTLSIYTVTHEYGHMLQNKEISNYLLSLGWTPETSNQYIDWSKKTRNAQMKFYEDAQKKVLKDCFTEIVGIAKANNPDFNLAKNISNYGQTNYAEFFAEVFANSQCGAPNELGDAMITWLEQKGY